MLAPTISLLALMPTLAAAPPQIDPIPRELILNVRIVGAIDVDGDGQTEVIGLGADRILRSYRTNAAGELINPKNLSPAGAPTPTAPAIPQLTADLDGDGLLDLVGTRTSSLTAMHEITVWFDRGGAQFEAPETIATFDSSYVEHAVLPNDFDGDGDLDLILHPQGGWSTDPTLGSRVQVVFNLGAAGYSAPTFVQSSSEAFVSSRPVDLNQDGDIDFVALRASSGAIAILRNTGGSLQVEAVPTSRPATRYLAVDDVNLDGLQDVVAFHTDALSPTFTAGDVDVYTGNGAGTLQAPTTVISAMDVRPLLTLSDVDGDGSLDVLLAELGPDSESPTAIRVYAGNGAGQFAAPVRSSEAPGSVGLFPMYSGDFNGDGRDDIAVTQREVTGRRRSVIRIARSGAASAGIGFKEPVFTDGHEYLGPALFADLDADGVQDMVTAVANVDGASSTVPDIIWGRGIVEPAHPFEAGRPIGIRGVPLLIADFDGNGPAHPSVIVRESTLGSGLYSVESGPNGQFQAPALIAPNVFSFNDTPQAIDWDQDGDLDLVGVGSTGRSLVWLEQTAPGSFANTSSVIATGDPAAFFVGFKLGDFNGDGTLDLTISGEQIFSSSVALSWRLGLGGGALSGELLLPAITSSPQVVDLNLDGFSDVAWFDGSPSRLRWIPGAPAGLVAGAAQDLVSGILHGGIISQVDFDGDQDVDIVIMERTSIATRTIRGYANLGGGSYSSTPTTVGETTSPANSNSASALITTDLGGDGDLDLITDTGFWYRNEANGIRGDSYCGPAVPNSNGLSGRILTLGSTDVAANHLQLRAVDLSALSFGYFITSQTPRTATTVPGSSGRICLAGAVGRYSSPSQVQFSGTAGMFALDIDLAQMPSPNGLIQALPGSTWYFQAWFRDSSPTGATSNFTDAVSIDFQ